MPKITPENTVLIQKTLSQNRRFRKITQKIAGQVALEHGITYTQFLALQTLNHQPNIDLNQLAQALHLSKSSTSGIVERLLHNALLAKTKQAADQRKVALCLTEKGQAITQAVHTNFYDCLAPITTLSTSELQQFINLQEKIIQNFEEAAHERQTSGS
ncbi:MarR family winged helix-turn-helix transcriptional regulator [Agrilactobacillus yilanensis]|uniref:MarR family winged helix-turn-helix transcriptional regulator n=1 Tax=Agrilactobacillus yilanensis TaxID=2485997 RepID=A0ABW4J6F0_9LACO|nr:MarR family winged helix-turn-helix transcriptional regulator [Agrilactobacillus yilanensis]